MSSDKNVVISPEAHKPRLELMKAPVGCTMTEILRCAINEGKFDKGDLPYVEIRVNGKLLPRREDALDRCLLDGEVVQISMAVRGDNPLKNAFQLIVQVTAIVVGFYFGPWAAAAVQVVGALATAALFRNKQDRLADPNSSSALNEQSNTIRRRAPMPLVLGRQRVAFDVAALSYTQNIGNDSWLNVIFGVHYGPCTVEQIKIGETLLADYPASDVQIEYSLNPGPKNFNLYPGNVFQENFNNKLDFVGIPGGTWETITPLPGARAASVDITLPGGLSYSTDKGKIRNEEVAGQIQIAEVGTENWQPAPFPGNDTARNKDNQLLPPGSFYLNMKTANAIRRTYTFNLDPTKNWKVRVRAYDQDNDSADDPGHTWDTYLTALRSHFDGKPIIDENLSCIAIRIKASGDLSNTLPTISGIVTPIVPVYKNGNWDTREPSSNQAALLRWCLTDLPAAKPLSPAEINGSCEAVYNLIQARDWGCALYITDDISQEDLMRLCGLAGRFATYWSGEDLCFVGDWEKPIARQVFSAANIKGYKYRREFQDEIHAVLVEFKNLDEDSRTDEVWVYADGYNANNSTLFETYSLQFACSQNRAYREGRVYLARRELKTETHEWTAGFDSVTATFGDRVRVSHYAALYGEDTGRVVNRLFSPDQQYVIGVRVDFAVEMEPGQSYSIDVRRSDQALVGIVLEPATERKLTKSLYFSVPLEVNAAPRKDDLVVFGKTNLVTEDVEIDSFDPQSRNEVRISASPYVATQIEAAETGPIPPLPTNLKPKERTPRVRILQSYGKPEGVEVVFDVAETSTNPIQGFITRWRYSGEDYPWNTLAILPKQERTVRTPPILRPAYDPDDPIDAVTLIDVQIITLSQRGDYSNPTTVNGIQVKKEVAAPTGFDAMAVVRTAPDGSSKPAIAVIADPVTAGDIQYLDIELGKVEFGGGSLYESAGSVSAQNPTGDLYGVDPGESYIVRGRFRTQDNWYSDWVYAGSESEPVAIPGGSSKSSDTVNVGGIPATQITLRLETVEGVASTAASGVANLEAVYGDTVSAAASAAAAAQSETNAIQAKADAIIAQEQTQSASAEAILAKADTIAAKNEAVSASGASASSASQAGGFKTDAETAAAASLQQKVEATAAREGAQAAANTPLATSPALSPDAFSINSWAELNGPQNLREVFANNPGKIYPINSTVEVNNFGSAVHINAAKAMARPEGHRFRYSARIRRMDEGGNASENNVTLFAWFWDANGGSLGGYEFQTVNPGTAQGTQTLTAEHLPPAGTAWTRTMVRVVSAVGVTAVLSLETLDIESEKAAAAAATSAATSAAAAAASESAAGQSASASQQDRVAAQTARGQAEGFRDQSSASATTAAGAAATATEQAGLSASARDAAQGHASSALASRNQASGFATDAETAAAVSTAQKLEAIAAKDEAVAKAAASATSAANAAASETAAGLSATASQTSATAADTSRGQAQTAATQASQSETNAAGSAASASSSATNAANSRDAAAGSASAAAGSASLAETKAGEAGNSATAAAASQVSASTARDIAAESASNASYLDVGAAFTFANTVDGWGAVNGSLSPSPSGARFIQSGADSQIIRSDLAILGARYTRVIVTLTRTKARTSGGWDGTLYFSTDSHGISGSFRQIVTRDPPVGERTELTWDMPSLPYGGTDWLTSTIRQIRLDLDQGPGGEFTIHNVRVVGSDTAAPAKSATAAATSASLASASETAAGQKASAAEGSATTAATRAGEAQTYRDQASTSAADANTAAINAGVSASTAQAAANNGFATSPGQALDSFAVNQWDVLNATANLRSAMNASLSVVNGALRVNSMAGGTHIHTAKAVARPAGHRFRIGASVRRVVEGGSASQNEARLFAWGWDASGNVVWSTDAGFINPGGGATQRIETEVTPTSGVVWIRAMLRIYSEVGATDVISIETTDAEDQISAASSAATATSQAASASASAASASISANLAARSSLLPNMLPNSTAAVDLSGWIAGAWFRSSYAPIGPFFFCNAAGDNFALSPLVPAQAGLGYTVSFQAETAGGVAAVYVAAYNADGSVLIQDGLGLLAFTSTDWTVRRSCPTFTLPAGASAFRVVLQKTGGASYAGITRIMANLGEAANWNDDASARTVEAQLSITASVAADTQSRLGTAAFEVLAGSGGDPAQLLVKAQGSNSLVQLVASALRFGNVVGGTIVEAMKLIGGEVFFIRPLYIDVGSNRLIVGPGGEWVLWFGGTDKTAATATRTNGVFSLGTDGKVYLGASELTSGPRRALVNAPNASVGSSWVLMAQYTMGGVSAGPDGIIVAARFDVTTFLFLPSGAGVTDFYGEMQLREMAPDGSGSTVLSTKAFNSTTGDPSTSTTAAGSRTGEVRYQVWMRSTQPAETATIGGKVEFQSAPNG
jgi:hypothetical protein